MLIKRYLILIVLILFVAPQAEAAVTYTRKPAPVFYTVVKPVEPVIEPVEAIVKPVRASRLSNTYYCVKWLREEMGVNIRGDAWTIQPNVFDGTLNTGDVLLLEYGNISHASLVLGFVDGKPAIIEANKVRGKVTERIIDFRSETLRGVYRPLEK